jgi:hypothetical protein
MWFDPGRTDDAVMSLHYDSSPPLRMDQALRFDANGPVPSPYQPIRRNTAMTRFKLELTKRKTVDKIALGATHIAAMTGNANYPQPTRVPTDAQVQTAQDDLATAQADVDAAEIAWKQKIQLRDQKEETWDTVITARANNCEAVTPNDLAALASTGFPLRAPPTPVGALPAPGDLRATATDNEGVIELRCDPVKGASSYEWECKQHDNVSAPWTAVKTSTTSKILVPGLTPGTLYAFRVRAVGSAGPGAWSDEASERAP